MCRYFNEPAVIVINVPLTLRGAQAGIDARTRTGLSETILGSDLGGFDVRASGTTIDGFSFTDQVVNASLNSAVATFAASTIVNNIWWLARCWSPMRGGIRVASRRKVDRDIAICEPMARRAPPGGGSLVRWGCKGW